MASIRRQGERYEIRECLETARGPRQRILARFRGVLTPDVLERAAAAARKPLRRADLIARARKQGVPVVESPRHPAARQLLGSLRGGALLDPTLVTLLREALSPLHAEPVPEHLEGVVDWLGRSEAERGKALRGLLRTASRVTQSRGSLRTPPPEPFPHFESRPTRALPADG